MAALLATATAPAPLAAASVAGTSGMDRRRNVRRDGLAAPVDLSGFSSWELFIVALGLWRREPLLAIVWNQAAHVAKVGYRREYARQRLVAL